jgi:hypothetical protein
MATLPPVKGTVSLGILERLFDRRKRLPELIGSCRQAKTEPFPNWK